MTFQIERLEFEDLCAFLHLQANDAFPDLKDEKRLKMLAEKWSNNAECSTCRDNDGNLIGMIAFYANRQGADFAYIPHVYVSSDYRRKGLFSLMMHRLIHYVKEKGFSEVRLEVAANNEIAQRSYQRNGFRFLPGQSENVGSLYMFLPVN